ncbi:MAG: hypothetical protein VX947_00980, partial [Chloroflexota bacterium]|nr:hypothetical protein [Chloroflexota bacterium]
DPTPTGRCADLGRPELLSQQPCNTMLEHKGMRWGYVFLRAASHIGEEEALVIMEQAVEMFLVGEEERNIKSSGFEGRLYTEMRYEIIGSLGGQRFDADLETPYGRDKASFLVSEQTQGLGGRISRN